MVFYQGAQGRFASGLYPWFLCHTGRSYGSVSAGRGKWPFRVLFLASQDALEVMGVTD